VENCCTLAVSFELVVHPVPPAQESEGAQFRRSAAIVKSIGKSERLAQG
jgi:hypothetical protein